MRQVPIRRPKDLGLAVAEARRLRRLSQAELADTAGIDRTYLVRLEAGLSTLLVERVLRLLRRLGAELVVVLPPEEPDPGERTS
ncbi:MAG: HTH-type transcriptional regulator / antitoxin HipB [Frankiaceae bacterium]|nr:HTH-type transcriptional regulator / antitoxin HipB [Frankiaceae bacterium]